MKALFRALFLSVIVFSTRNLQGKLQTFFVARAGLLDEGYKNGLCKSMNQALQDGYLVKLQTEDRLLLLNVVRVGRTIKIVTNYDWDEGYYGIIAEILKFFPRFIWFDSNLDNEKFVPVDSYIEVNDGVTVKLGKAKHAVKMLSVVNQVLQTRSNESFRWYRTLISREVVKAIETCLITHSFSGGIEIEECAFAAGAFPELCSVLSLRNYTPRFCLRKCWFEEGVTPATLAPLNGFIKTNVITSLVLSDLKLKKTDLDPIMEFLTGSKIETVDLSLNKLSDEEAIQICCSLIENSHSIYDISIRSEKEAEQTPTVASADGKETWKMFVETLKKVKESFSKRHLTLCVNLANNTIGETFGYMLELLRVAEEIPNGVIVWGNPDAMYEKPDSTQPPAKSPRTLREQSGKKSDEKVSGAARGVVRPREDTQPPAKRFRTLGEQTDEKSDGKDPADLNEGDNVGVTPPIHMPVAKRPCLFQSSLDKQPSEESDEEDSSLDSDDSSESE